MNCRRTLSLLVFVARRALAQPSHPLDSISTAEYWTAYDVLQQAGRFGPDTLFASELLREPGRSRSIWMSMARATALWWPAWSASRCPMRCLP